MVSSEPESQDAKPTTKVTDIESGGDGKKKELKPSVGFFEVFRFASRLDILLMIIGALAAVAHGTLKPLMVIVFGQIIDQFADPNQYCGLVELLNGNETIKEFYQNATQIFNLTCVDAVRKNQTELIGSIVDAISNLDPIQQAQYFKILEKAYESGLLNQTIEICRSIVDAEDYFLSRVLEQITYFCIIGAVSFVTGYIETATWMYAAESQVKRIRSVFFKQLLRQDVGWYDQQESGSVTSKFAEDILNIHKGIGDKFVLIFMALSSFFAGIVIAFVKGWELSLVVLSLSPLLAGSAMIMMKFAFRQSQDETNAYAKAGSIAQEVLGSVRTVASFGGQLREVERYAEDLDEARKFGTKKGMLIGIMMGTVFFIIFGSYALGFSYGIKLINDARPGYSIGVVTTTFYAVIMGTFSLGMSVTSLQVFTTARSAAYNVFQVIDRVAPIDAYSKTGKKKAEGEKFDCRIEFKNISFRYPTRPDVPILRDVSFAVEPGTTVALVGASGCGKSTVVQLLQRFYDPEAGSVLIDGVDLRDYNIFWFRTLIGSVSQEPVLFGTTVYENIRYGYPHASKDEIERAAKLANAHDFITKLPNGYDTLVGEQGAQLSGGQKQRIAIARALVRNPRILLLDEATSALDTESEATVQDALDKARAGRTTIAIAHRLSTIMNADKIIVIEAGQVYETGTHAELIAKQGIYAKLVEAQNGRNVADIDLEFATAHERRAALVQRKRRSTMTDDSAPASPTKGRQLVAKENEVPQSKAVAGLSADEKKKVEDNIVKQHFSARRLWGMAKPEWPFIAIGALGSVACGAVWPAFAIIFSQMMDAFTECDKQARYEKGLTNSLIFLAIGFSCFIGYSLMISAFAFAGERLCARIRKMTFHAMLRQEIAWFDDEDNATGALTSRLATQCGQVRDATGPQLAQIVQTVVSLFAGIIIAFVYDWRVSLIMLAFVPFLIFAGIVRGKLVGDTIKQDKFVEDANKYLVQSTTNIRTVTSLGVYRIFIDLFNEPLNDRHKQERKKVHFAGILFGFSEGVVMFAYATAFYAGAEFVKQGLTDFGNLTTALGAIMFTAVAVGQANAMAPDQRKAQIAVAEIFKLFDRTPTIMWDQAKGEKPESFQGNVLLEGVQFCYPSRPGAAVLQGLDIRVHPGQTFALVGASGCGKSTIIQLLERFYDPEKGDVKLDESTVSSLDLPWVRGTMSLVSQEPILFDRTIAENISYGVDGLRGATTGLSATQEEIEEAARLANIHDFVLSLPDGYKTRVGERGTQLSGGQKQRIAIARALVRQPQLLLLDEATSALDSESEKVVQVALDRARSGRTVVVIAHRLSTIESADVIAVIQGGVVREIGTHMSLLERKGLYYALWSAQQLTS